MLFHQGFEGFYSSMTSIADSGQVVSQAVHIMHSSSLTGLDFWLPSISTISKTSTGQVSTQVPHPVHFSKSTLTLTVFFTLLLMTPRWVLLI